MFERKILVAAAIVAGLGTPVLAQTDSSQQQQPTTQTDQGQQPSTDQSQQGDQQQQQQPSQGDQSQPH